MKHVAFLMKCPGFNIVKEGLILEYRTIPLLVISMQKKILNMNYYSLYDKLSGKPIIHNGIEWGYWVQPLHKPYLSGINVIIKWIPIKLPSISIKHIITDCYNDNYQTYKIIK